ncbi:unnamed protein product [Cylicocyclus nassatus]|uniref:Uncharacterized protein n=1 Tax=Cylicocyclus nassatus TaxID=53992 RepID=A0AA36GRC0_CYLNA|nr:unnamed protein product [Cylicocyclus nassatus]
MSAVDVSVLLPSKGECNYALQSSDSENEEYETSNSVALGIMRSLSENISFEHSRILKLLDVDFSPESSISLGVAISKQLFAILFGFGIFMSCVLIVTCVVNLVRTNTISAKYSGGKWGIILPFVLLSISCVGMICVTIKMSKNAYLAQLGADSLSKKLGDFGTSGSLKINASNAICLLKSTAIDLGVQQAKEESLSVCLKTLTESTNINTGKVSKALRDSIAVALNVKKVAKGFNVKDAALWMEKVANDFLEKIHTPNSDLAGKTVAFESEIRNIKKMFNALESKMIEVFNSFVRLCEEVIEKLIRNTKEVDENMKSLLTIKEIAFASNYFLFVIWFPSAIAVMCLFADVSLIIGVINVRREDYNDKKPYRGRVSQLAASMNSTFAYLTFAFGAILSTMFSFGLLFGFRVAVLSSLLLGDSQEYNRISFAVTSIYKNDPIYVNVKEVLAECKSGENVFQVTKLNQLLPSGTLIKILNGSVDRDSYNAIFSTGLESLRNFYVQLSEKADITRASLTKRDLRKYDNFKKEVNDVMKKYENALKQLATAAKSVEVKVAALKAKQKSNVESITTNLDNFIKAMVALHVNIMAEVSKRAGKCAIDDNYRRKVHKYWEAYISDPVQGQWLHCFIAVIFSIIAAIGLLSSVQYLKNYETDDYEEFTPLDKTASTIRHASGYNEEVSVEPSKMAPDTSMEKTVPAAAR